MDIRTRIDELLAEKRWGRKTLSRAMGGVSEDFVRKFMENPAQQMGHENLIKAADALGVTTEYLLHGNPITEEAEAQRVVSIFRDIAQSDRSIALEVLKKFAEPKADG